MKTSAPNLNRMPPNFIIGLAYSVPDLVQRHIAKEGGPLKLFDLLDLVNEKCKVRMTSGELYDMLRYAGCTMEKDEGGDLVFSGFSPAYEALRTARQAASATRRDRSTLCQPKEDMTNVAENAARAMTLIATDRLRVGEAIAYEELYAMLLEVAPQYADVARNMVARAFYKIGRVFEPFSQRCGSTPKRFVRRLAHPREKTARA